MKFGSVCSGIEAASVAEKTCTKCGAKKPLTDYIKSYLPCAVILSNQIDGDILLRYRAEKWAVITGVVGLNNPLASTYDFMRDVVGYDLAGFFQRNTETLRTEVDAVLRALLAPDGH